MQFITNSVDETYELAEKIALMLVGKEIIILDGELGAGKTTFTKGLAKALGVAEEVTSPTFVLMKEYKGKFNLCHFDMYRIENVDELAELGFEDYFYDDNICIIEWNKIATFLHRPIVIKIERLDENIRRFEINGLYSD